MQKPRFLFVVFSLCLLMVTSSCTRRISPNTYSASSVGEASQAFKGYIVSARKVTVQEAERFQDNALGMGVGALAGGFLGSQVGGGSSAHVVGGVLGALAGGAGGAFVQDQLGSQEAFEYTVQLDNGRLMTVVQGMDEVYAAGQRVMVIISHQGRSRVVPDHSPQPVQHVVYHQAPSQPVMVQPVQAKSVGASSSAQVQYVQASQQTVGSPLQTAYDVPQPQIVYHKSI